MIKRMFKGAMIIAFILVFLSACDGEVPFPGNEAKKETETIISDTISIPIEKIRTLNPLLSLDEDTYYLNKLIYQGLFKLNTNLAAENVLAESYMYKDEVTLTIDLTKDVLWQDGEVFTAQDVKFTYDAYKDTPVNKQGTYAPFAAMVKSVKVIDLHTVEMQFADANNATVENLTIPILPSHIYKRTSDIIKSESGFVPLGTGPYQIDNIEDGKQIILTGNINYKGTIPKNTLIFKFMSKKEDALNLFNLGEINMTYLRDIDRDTLIENKAVNIVSFLSNEVEILGFNFDHGALQDSRVRRAIAHAIENRRILETCYFNSGFLNDTIYYPGYMGKEPGESLYKYDTFEASRLLQEAGYEGLYLNMIFNGGNKSRNLAAQAIKSELERIGISVNLISLEQEEYDLRLSKGDFDLYIGGFRISENYDLRPLLHSEGALNYIRYYNEEIDRLLDKMQQGISQSEKERTFRVIHSIYAKELPYHCLLYKTYGLIVSKGFNGETNPSFYNVYDGSENWQIIFEKPTE